MTDRPVPAGRFPYAPHTLDLGDGIALRYVDEGAGPNVLCVHGNPTWSYLWRDVIADLRRDHRVVAPDHVGMGRSSVPLPHRYPYTLDRRVADLDRLVGHLDLDGPVTLVLHDWGGAIGMSWAVDHPDRVAGIVLCNTAAFPLPDGHALPWQLGLARGGVGDLLVCGLNAFVRGTLAVGARSRLPADVRAGYLAPYRRSEDRLAVREFVRDIPVGPGDPAWDRLQRTADRLDRLRDVAALLLWGDRDPVFDDGILDEWRRRLPAAEVRRFPDAGHLVVDDARDHVVPAIRRFLAGATR